MGGNMDKGVDGAAHRLILWCLPRTGSTALAKCLSFLDDDTEVWFEPFNQCRMADIELNKASGQHLPKEFKGNEAIFDMVVTALKQQPYVQSDPSWNIDPYLFSYAGVKKSLEESRKHTVIVKEMAVATYNAYDYIPKGYRHILFIRDPARVVPSFRKMVMESQGIVSDKADLEKLHPRYPTHHWFGEMHALWKQLKAKLGASPLIIDTEDFLANPAPFIKKICEVAEVEYRDELLQWDASKDIVSTWKNACIDMYTSDQVSQALVFKRAFESSGFIPTAPKALPESLTEDCVRIISKCVDFYNEMYQFRYIPEQN